MSLVALTHGWGYGDAVWQPLAQALTTRGWEVRLAGLPGFDDRDALPPERWHEAVAAQVPAGALWVAWSLGGRLALRAVAEGRARPAALCLIGVGRAFVSDCGAGMASEEFAAFRAELQDPARLQRRFAGLVALGDPRRKTVLRRLRFLPLAASVETLGRGLDLLEASLPLECIPATVAIRLLHGRFDALVPEAATEALTTALPQTRLSRLPAGHAPHLSDPEAVADWLEGGA